MILVENNNRLYLSILFDIFILKRLNFLLVTYNDNEIITASEYSTKLNLPSESLSYFLTNKNRSYLEILNEYLLICK